MPTSRVNARVLIVKKILPLLLLATLGMLAALPHIAAADDQGDQGLNGAHDQTDHEIGHETLAEFHIRLTGDQQVPSVNTTAFGFAEVRLFQNGTSSAIEFRVSHSRRGFRHKWPSGGTLLQLTVEPILEHKWLQHSSRRYSGTVKSNAESRSGNRQLD